MISTPSAASRHANSSKPLLSYTLISARSMGTRASGAAEKVSILFVLDGFPKELFESSVVDGSGRPSHVASEAVAVGDLFLFYFFGVASFAVRAATFSALLFYPRLQPDLPAFQRHDVFQRSEERRVGK